MTAECQHEWQPFGHHGKYVCSKCLTVTAHIHTWVNYPGMPSCIIRCATCGDVAYFSKSLFRGDSE